MTAPYLRAGGPPPLSSLHSVTVSWDDHLLIDVNTTYDSGLASNYWHS